MSDTLSSVDDRPVEVPDRAKLYSACGQTRFLTVTPEAKYTGQVRRVWLWIGDDGLPRNYSELVPPNSEELETIELGNPIRSHLSI